MEVIDAFIGYREIHKGIYSLLRTAKSDIYISASKIDVNIVLRHSATLREVLLEAASQRDVNVRILESAPLVPLSADEEALQIIPSVRCRKYQAARFGPTVMEQLSYLPAAVRDKIGPVTQHILQQCVYSMQYSFILVDNQVAIVGCLGLDPEERQSWYTKLVQPLTSWLPSNDLFGSITSTSSNSSSSNINNTSKSYFHSVALLVRATEDFTVWANENWSAKGHAMPPLTKVNFGGSFVKNVSTEIDRIHSFVAQARESLYIESEFFYCNEFTHNQVARAIAHRISRCLDPRLRHSDPFVCIILTNLGQDSQCDQVLQTIDFLRELWKTAGTEEDLIPERFFLGHLLSAKTTGTVTKPSVEYNEEQKESLPVRIKGSLLIRDESEVWVSTSGIHDSHLMRKSLRVGVHGISALSSPNHIQHCLKRCLARHLFPVPLPQVPAKSNIIKEVLPYCYAHQGSIRKIRRVGLASATLVAVKEFMTNTFLGDILHSL